MASPLPLPFPASAGLGAWLQGRGRSFVFFFHSVDKLLFIGNAEPADGTSAPGQPANVHQLKRQERRFVRPMDQFVAGESLWMPPCCQIWHLVNLFGSSQLHVGGDLLPGVRQPWPLGPQGEPHQGPSVRPFGLSEPSAAEISTPQTKTDINDAAALGAYGSPTAAAPAVIPIHSQRVFHHPPADLPPYSDLTFPSLAPGTITLARIQGELTLKVDLLWRGRGIGTDWLQRLTVFLAKEAIAPLSLRSMASPEIIPCFEPILARRGWSQQRTDVLLVEGRSDQLAAIDWVDRHPITAAYSLLPRQPLTGMQRTRDTTLNVPADLQPPADPQRLEPIIDLAVLHHHAPGGWLLAHRSAAASMRYSSLDVVAAHRGQARRLALLSKGLRRQHAGSMSLLKRHQAARLSSLGHSRHGQSPTLASPSPPPRSFPNPPNPPPPKQSLDP